MDTAVPVLSGSTAIDATFPSLTTMAYRFDLSPPKMAEPSKVRSRALVNAAVGSARNRIYATSQPLTKEGII